MNKITTTKPEKWNKDELAKFFDLQVSSLETTGFTKIDFSEILKKEKDSLLSKIKYLLPFENIQIPFIINPNSSKPYCLVDVSCDAEFITKSTKEYRRIIIFKNRSWLSESDMLIFEKVIYPMIKNLSPEQADEKHNLTESLTLRYLWNVTSYGSKVYI